MIVEGSLNSSACSISSSSSTAASSECSFTSEDYNRLSQPVIFYVPAKLPNYYSNLGNRKSMQNASNQTTNQKSLISGRLFEQQAKVLSALELIVSYAEITDKLNSDLCEILVDMCDLITKYSLENKAVPLDIWHNLCGRIIQSVECDENKQLIHHVEARKIKDIAKISLPFKKYL